MKLGVMTVPLYDRSTEEAFAFLSKRGVEMLEIGTGGSPGTAHCPVEELLSSENKLTEYKDLLKKYNLEISAFSVHSNHVHPNKEIRELAHKEFINTCKLAEKFQLDTVVTFSGCPGDFEGAKYPNWVTCAWPDDFQEILKYQWDDVLIPYWESASKEAAQYGVSKIALELHPGFMVYNTVSLLRLRESVGPAIGVNFDPSHLFWQQVDPIEAIKALEGSIYHFHAKDTQINPVNVGVRGVLDYENMSHLDTRSWVFRTVGYGHDAIVWKNMMAALRLAGYDKVISIEHEDAYMSIEEGLDKGISFLKDIIIKDKPAQAWWT